jgi:uncharacterized protein YgbK (DUF1537 family)
VAGGRVIVLVADDLTGAADAGVQLARRGLRTRVLLDLSDAAACGDVEALSVDTDTRALPAAAAYRRVRQVATKLRAVAPEHVYKKVDSTLRGNLGAEIDAVMDAFGLQLAVVAPAFPALGRTTRRGIHYLRGTPIHQTEIGRDPRAPVTESDIVRVLEGQSRRTAALVPLETVAAGPMAVRREVDLQLERGARLLVFDAEGDDHLRSVATALADRRDLLWVGSAGLAEQLAEFLGLAVRPPGAPPAEPAGGPVLLVAGSASETTRQQVAAFEACPGVRAVRLDPLALVGTAAECAAEMARCRQALQTALADGDDCALAVEARPESVRGAEQRGAERGLGRAEVAARIADALGQLAADGLRDHPVGGLILTGGDTARAVCRHLGATGFELLAEVEPGVPLGRLVGQTGLLAVTKAGAFGSEQALVRAREQLLKGAPQT